MTTKFFSFTLFLLTEKNAGKCFNSIQVRVENLFLIGARPLTYICQPLALSNAFEKKSDGRQKVMEFKYKQRGIFQSVIKCSICDASFLKS